MSISPRKITRSNQPVVLHLRVMNSGRARITGTASFKVYAPDFLLERRIRKRVTVPAHSITDTYATLRIRDPLQGAYRVLGEFISKDATILSDTFLNDFFIAEAPHATR